MAYEVGSVPFYRYMFKKNKREGRRKKKWTDGKLILCTSRRSPLVVLRLLLACGWFLIFFLYVISIDCLNWLWIRRGISTTHNNSVEELLSACGCDNFDSPLFFDNCLQICPSFVGTTQVAFAIVQFKYYSQFVELNQW